jgi:hypothetical protein
MTDNSPTSGGGGGRPLVRIFLVAMVVVIANEASAMMTRDRVPESPIVWLIRPFAVITHVEHHTPLDAPRILYVLVMDLVGPPLGMLFIRARLGSLLGGDLMTRSCSTTTATAMS